MVFDWAFNPERAVLTAEHVAPLSYYGSFEGLDDGNTNMQLTKTMLLKKLNITM